MRAHSMVIAADIGGSHITAALVDLEKKCIADGSLVREHVNSHAQATEIMNVWSRCMMAAKGTAKTVQACLALPGPFDYEAGVCQIQNQDKYPGLYGLNIKNLLAEKLSVQPQDIYMNNDAACFLQGEVFAGSAQRYDKVLGVTLGTGLGSAIYKSGLAVSADCWSMPFLDSIAEDYLSTRWFIKRFADITGIKISGVKELSAITEEIDNVKNIFTEFGLNLAGFLSVFLQKEPANAIVIGGNIAHASPWFMDTMKEALQKDFPDVMVSVSLLGEKAAILGAGSAWHYRETASAVNIKPGQ